ncbi:membrane-bound alkaline phosphatase-like [Contarinia nasturtii]|uniref:membrane-bound alkaline phosphatase-like n=1 Tax=Contarinia nasturtii TaxID=265458 RepID=UPI0012D401A7|nr:membrane-bound alkaline phosphatase-like [Contarinia nasturtii]XP_031628393.1 membrane-bound alkaline phosphatase-like [Contarinia nasturtii]
MKQFVVVVLLLLAVVERGIEAKPGFDRVPEIAVTSYLYHDELHRDYHLKKGVDFVQQQITKTSNLNENVAKNTILFLGDGMSIPTLAATRVYGVGGEEKALSFENFPHVAMSKTYCVDMQVADSACTATAYLNGVKANYGTIGVSAKVRRTDCTAGTEKAYHTESIAKWALNAGKSIGLVTTTRVTHASPAGVYAHTAERDWENDAEVLNAYCNDQLVDDIAEQLVHGEVGKHLKVIFGGGRRNFVDKSQKDEEGNPGSRTDGKNLISEWLNNQHKNEQRKYVWNKHGLLSLQPSANESVLGLFAPSHCEYNHLIDGISEQIPTLKEMTMKAIEILQTNPNGFFLFVEGGRIDHGLHDNTAHIAFEETAEFSRAIKLATKMLSTDDTLFVVTADHSHTLTLGGYPDRGSNIFGIASQGDADFLPYMKLSFANGPAYEPKNTSQREDPTKLAAKMNNYDFLSPVTVPRDQETHGGDDVAIFAMGPHAHLFTGSMEQHTIPHFMAYASCIGDGITYCNKSKGYGLI